MNKWIKRILLTLIAIILLVQIPFIYRRYETGKLAQRIAELNANRTERTDANFREYKGIIHAHTNLGGHSTGSFDELIAAANQNGLDFVLMTEHWTDAYDTSALTLNGVYGNTLFVGGNEIDTADSDRFLMIRGSRDAAGLRHSKTDAVLEKLHAENRLALITYPEKFKTWDSNFDGIEVFSLHTSAKKMNPLTAPFDIIWSFPSYPELTFASYFKRPDDNLRKFDEISANRKITLFAGTDAHSNIGFHVFGDDAGNKLINLKFDPYRTTFGIVRTHILIENDKPLTPENVNAALKNGRAFIGIDAWGDTTGFSFKAEHSGEIKVMGDEVALSPDLTLSASAPQSARFVFYRNGEVYAVSSESGELSSFQQIKPDRPGTYRVEVYLDQLGSPMSRMPWIVSNPIYVR
jgi:hypothetical protein